VLWPLCRFCPRFLNCFLFRGEDEEDVRKQWLLSLLIYLSQNGQDPRKSPKNHSMAMQELGTLKLYTYNLSSRDSSSLSIPVIRPLKPNVSRMSGAKRPTRSAG